ncbi:MAG: hypothetical protein R2783_08050 [Gelidibacter sp.]
MSKTFWCGWNQIGDCGILQPCHQWIFQEDCNIWCNIHMAVWNKLHVKRVLPTVSLNDIFDLP